ncbi:LOW QUALITY PROTEIN: hypothetical protein U9M48_044334 [Paspalum notatum var. saurae]|uniref:Uncharacterized protein n=1 Tax=Paspalum notatum var. saurae TaxID=547442 RepID=A0AAQ3V145_PASNO
MPDVSSFALVVVGLSKDLRSTGTVEDDMGELREFVDHLLLLRGIAPLETCDIRFDSIIVDADTFSSSEALRVNLWFQHAVRCQTRVGMAGEYEYCDLPGPHLVYHSQHLVELELVGVAVEESFLDLSGCPALEQLRMIHDCYLCDVEKISSKSL